MLFFMIALCSCKVNPSLVNLSHLQHLYEERNIDGKLLGTEWIYCEAPDFRLVGDEDEGYTCVDDVARTLVVYCREMKKKPSDELLYKIESLSNFILYMQNDNGYFYNFIFEDGTINKTHQNSVAIAAFWSWRAYWALTEVMLVDNERLNDKKLKCEKAIEKLEKNIFSLCDNMQGNSTFEGITLPSCIAKIGSDQMAEILKGMSNHYKYTQSDVLAKNIKLFGNQIIQTQQGSAQSPPYFAFLSWQNYWHAWGNSQSYSLLKAGTAINDTTMIRAALNEIDHFYPFLKSTNYLSGFKLVNENNNLKVTEKQEYAQIAYGFSPMIIASTEAYLITKNKKYATISFELASWYFGNNITKSTMYDVKSGRGHDGINGINQVNKNAGAESTIESLLAMQALENISKGNKEYKEFVKKIYHQQEIKYGQHIFQKCK